MRPKRRVLRLWTRSASARGLRGAGEGAERRTAERAAADRRIDACAAPGSSRARSRSSSSRRCRATGRRRRWRVRGQGARPSSRRAREEKIGQGRDVLAPIAQWWQNQLDYGNDRRVLAERALADRAAEPVGGGDDTDVDGPPGSRRAGGSRALQRAEQLPATGRSSRSRPEKRPPSVLKSRRVHGGAGEAPRM